MLLVVGVGLEEAEVNLYLDDLETSLLRGWSETSPMGTVCA
jgi:hypothetical protein